MAHMTLELPNDIIEDFRKIYDNYDHIVGEMTRAGAQVVYNTVVSSVPAGIAGSEMMKCLKVTKTYKTPSDGGTATKVGFFGYFKNKRGKLTPAPLVANVFEYGSSKQPKQPFFRRAFNNNQIEAAMLEAQKNASGGLLE